MTGKHPRLIATVRTGQDGPVGSSPQAVSGFRLTATAGPSAGRAADARDGRLTVGSEPGNGLCLDDRTVSRCHLELEICAGGVAVRDLGATNGTRLAGLLVREVVVQEPVEIALGDSRIRLELVTGGEPAALAHAGSFGTLVGAGTAMRAVCAVLEQAAPTTAPILIMGESGTGKELAAHAVHAASARHSGPFEVVDCGGLPATLVENELFGHERGAFTHAASSAVGAFERAHGGTLFLDELGELPLEVQPKLLRALGQGEVRRIGGQKPIRVDVRIVAATNRDLRSEVNAGRFRADLYYRLAVIEVRMPPLRDRLDDLPALVPALLEQIGRERGLRVELEPDESLYRSLRSHGWPGNVRELRNHLEHLIILRAPPPRATAAPTERPVWLEGLAELPLRIAKARLLERFEREYLSALLDQTSGNVAEAARRSGVDRRTLFRTIRRYGLKARDE